MAGLLDALVGGDGSGGLLNFLRQNAMNQQFPGLQSSDTAQYAPQPQMNPLPAMQPSAQPSPLDSAQWPYGPNGAPSQAYAQMPQQAAPQPIQQPIAAQPSLGDHLLAGLQSFANTNTGGLIGKIVNGVGGLATGERTDPTTQANNLTARALLAKGVPPAAVQAAIANPEVMKMLVTQAFGPQTVTSLGNGYVADRNGKITRAYTPDDKTPVGFALGDDGSMHFVPGGPADPAYLRLKAAQAADPNAVHVLGKGGELYKVDKNGIPTIVHKNESEADATLDDKTTQAMASQYLAGDKSVMTNLGRGAQGAANIVKLRTEIYKQAGEQGLDGRAIVNNFNEQAGALAGQRTVGTRAANISLAANEANNMIPIALAASAKVPRSQYMPWNKMVQAVQKGASSPELASFVAATNSLVNSYVRAVSPSGVPTDSMREHAYSMLNSAQSPEAYAAVINTMRQEMQSALDAPAQVKKELRGQGSNSESAPKAPVKIDGYTITEH